MMLVIIALGEHNKKPAAPQRARVSFLWDAK
jgi:hypothetical protein